MSYFLVTLLAFFNTLINCSPLQVLVSVGGIFFLGFPVMAKVSAYTVAILEKSDFNPLVAMLIAILLTIIIAIGFYYLYLRVSNDSFAVIGLAAMLAVEALIISWDDLTNGLLGIPGIPRPEIANSIPSLLFVTILFALIVLVFEWLFFQTKYGRALRAMKENNISVEALGINPNKIILGIMITMAVVFSFSTSLYLWRVQFLAPSFAGLHYLILLLTIAIMAHRPKVTLLILSTVFVFYIPELLRFFPLPSAILGYSRLVIYSLLLIVLLINLSPKFITSSRKI
ncbi:hypothetical protein GF340_01620 [Candidatus Peregrinibacteria bacterium]|nr:hypothetical protein [Candidatus Peregrinibacteria bacterium]